MFDFNFKLYFVSQSLGFSLVHLTIIVNMPKYWPLITCFVICNTLTMPAVWNCLNNWLGCLAHTGFDAGDIALYMTV